jgi:hypothetical protein
MIFESLGQGRLSGEQMRLFLANSRLHFDVTVEETGGSPAAAP